MSQSLPFAVLRHNGINLTRSVSRANSNTARIVNFIRDRKRPVTKREILTHVFGMDCAHVTVGSQGSNLFAALNQAGILIKRRRAGTVFYILGDNAYVVTT